MATHFEGPLVAAVGSASGGLADIPVNGVPAEWAGHFDDFLGNAGGDLTTHQITAGSVVAGLSTDRGGVIRLDAGHGTARRCDRGETPCASMVRPFRAKSLTSNWLSKDFMC